MAASTITRVTWIDGPAGTVINNARKNSDIYDKIDEMFAGAGSYATFTLGGKLAVEGFGTHTVSSGGSGGNILAIRNTTAGTTNYGGLQVGNDTSANLGELKGLSSSFTTAAHLVQSGVALISAGAGGLSIAATHPSGGVVRFYSTAGEIMRMFASGGVNVFGTADPGVSEFRVTGSFRCTSGIYVDGGVYFPSTANPSMGSTTLDEYREGIWTPVIGGTTSQTGQAYSIQVGWYIKKGKEVTAGFYAVLTNKGTITGGIQISGLPFTSDSTANVFAVAPVTWYSLNTTWYTITMELAPNSTAALLRGISSASGAAASSGGMVTGDLTAASQFIGTITYQANS